MRKPGEWIDRVPQPLFQRTQVGRTYNNHKPSPIAAGKRGSDGMALRNRLAKTHGVYGANPSLFSFGLYYWRGALSATLLHATEVFSWELSEAEKRKVLSLGCDLRVWTAPSTTDRDRKELLRILLEEVYVTVDLPERRAHLTLR